MDVVRKSDVTINATFEDPTGAGLTPTSASVNIWYPGLDGTRQIVTLPMTLSDGVWSVTWATSAASAGLVEWAAWSEGPLRGAAQGSFNLIANKANVT